MNDARDFVTWLRAESVRIARVAVFIVAVVVMITVTVLLW